jgi:hypothetical protein
MGENGIDRQTIPVTGVWWWSEVAAGGLAAYCLRMGHLVDHYSQFLFPEGSGEVVTVITQGEQAGLHESASEDFSSR